MEAKQQGSPISLIYNRLWVHTQQSIVCTPCAKRCA